MAPLLLASVFVIATCGLVYELIAGTLASYLLGDSVTQFSTIIGCYLFAMGVGSWASRYVTRNLIAFFVRVEILVGLVGGASAAVLFLMFEHVGSFRVLLYAVVGLVGMLVGVEIPILLRILKDELEFKDLVSRVFTFDYIGALFASILFPLVLVPYLGLVRSSFLFGTLNVLVAGWVLIMVRRHVPALRLHMGAVLASLALLIGGFFGAERITALAEASSYAGTVIFAESSPYQRIVLTRRNEDLRLYLNGNLQFSSLDEYRYHEALVHPLLASLAAPRRVLVIGGGDGLAIREILKYPAVESITLVDLDPAMTRLFSTNPMLVSLNGGAFASPRVTVVNADAFLWLRDRIEQQGPRFDAIVIDLPDPSNFSIGKLYSLSFYRLLDSILAEGGGFVVQSTSPLVARKSFWCVNNTIGAAGFVTSPYHAYVPSFGDWGYVLATRGSYRPPVEYPAGLRFLTIAGTAEMFRFPPDMARVETGIQRLDDQVLIHYFDDEWSSYLVY